MRLSRREMLKLLLAGATVMAGEIWIPGSKTISIPKSIDICLYEASISEEGEFELSWYERHPNTHTHWRHVKRLLKPGEKIPYPINKAFSERGMLVQPPPEEFA